REDPADRLLGLAVGHRDRRGVALDLHRHSALPVMQDHLGGGGGGFAGGGQGGRGEFGFHRAVFPKVDAANPPRCSTCTVPSAPGLPSAASQRRKIGSSCRACSSAVRRQPSGLSCNSPVVRSGPWPSSCHCAWITPFCALAWPCKSPSDTSPSGVRNAACRHCKPACISSGQPPCSNACPTPRSNSPCGWPNGRRRRGSASAERFTRACTPLQTTWAADNFRSWPWKSNCGPSKSS